LNPIALDYTYFFQIISFLIVVYILVKFAWKPLMRMMEKRRQFIETNLAQAEADRLEAERIRKEYQAEMREAHQAAQSLIEKATKASEQRAAEILAQAREEAEKTRVAALTQIDMERARAIAEIQTQVADLSVAVAEKIIRQNLDLSGQRTLIDQFIQEVGNEPC